MSKLTPQLPLDIPPSLPATPAPNAPGMVLPDRWRKWFLYADKQINSGAALPSGFYYTAPSDWVLTIYSGEYAYLAQNAVLNIRPQSTGIGLTIASESSAITTGGFLNYTSLVYNNNTADAIPMWMYYGTGIIASGVTGYTHGIELDIANLGTTKAIFPGFMFTTGSSACLWIAAGGEVTASQTVGVTSVALGILSNDAAHNACFEKGIVFHNYALSGTTGTSGGGIAIAFATYHSMNWYNNSNNLCGSIVCTNTGSTTGQLININSSGLLIQDIATSGLLFEVTEGASYVNYPVVNGTASGGGTVAFGANQSGGDTNIDVFLVPKGSGYTKFGTYTGSPATSAGYISIKDSGGTVRKLMVGT